MVVLMPQITYITPVVGRAMHPSKDAHIPVPKTCALVTLHGQWDFIDAIKGTNLEMERLPWIRLNEILRVLIISQKEKVI